MDILYEIYIAIRIIVDFGIDFIYGLYFDSKRRYLPSTKNEIVLESAVSLAKKIRNRKVKVETVVGAFIERTKEVNPYINAMVDDRFLEALKEARKLDEDIASGKITELDFGNKPLLGIPFTAKESAASKGLKWSFGLLVRKNVLADEDSTAVRLMKEAGAIQIGVTNVPQVNFWAETYNPVYGTSCNPYNTTKNAGGSSGGEGSLIAACGSPIGIGTDIGGSVRIPSHRCGIFGHKPIPNLIPNKGQLFSDDTNPSLSTVGVMAKRAEDLLPMFKVLLNGNVGKLKLDENVDVSKLNVIYMTSINGLWHCPIQKQMQENVIKVAKHFEDISGRKPTKVDFADMKHAVKLFSYKMTVVEGTSFRNDITNRNGEANVLLEYVKYLCGMSEYSFYSLCNMLNVLLPPVDMKWAEKTLTKLKEDVLAKLLGNNGILIFPSEARPADYHYTMILRPNLSYFCLWNALELPVTQVPMGLDSNGLPIGVQIVTAPYQDHLSLAVARELENAFGGYVPPRYQN